MKLIDKSKKIYNESVKTNPQKAAVLFSCLTIFCFIFFFVILNMATRGELIFDYGLPDDRDTLGDHFKPLAVYKHANLRELLANTKGSIYPAVSIIMYKCFTRFIPADAGLNWNELRGYEFALFPYLVFLMLILVGTHAIIVHIKSGELRVRTFFSISCMLTSGFLFALERGNQMIICPILILIFLHCYDSDNRLFKELGLISLALAAGIKIRPAILGMVLLVKKKWKEAFRCICYGGFLLIGVSIIFGGVSAPVKMVENTTTWAATWGDPELIWGYSFEKTSATIMKLLGVGESHWAGVQSICFYIACFIVIIAIFLSFCTKKEWKRIFLLTLPMIIMYKQSYKYDLIFLIPVLAYFCNEEGSLDTKESRIVFALLCAILLPYSIPVSHTFLGQFTYTDVVRQLSFLSLYLFVIISELIRYIQVLRRKYKS